MASGGPAPSGQAELPAGRTRRHTCCSITKISGLDRTPQIVHDPRMFFYMIPPVDYWPGSTTFDPDEQRARALSKPDPADYWLSEQVELAKAIIKAIDQGTPVFERWGLGTTIRERRYGCVPGDTQTEVWVGIKEENNGTTYIASPVAIPSLDELAFRTSTD
jgi:hypothetical protein